MPFRTNSLFLALLLAQALAFACAAGPASADPSDFYFYTVRRGDTLESVARQYRVEWKSIASLNGMRKPYGLQKGQVLKIPRQKFRVKQTRATTKEDMSMSEVIPVTFIPSAADVARIKALLDIDAPEMLHWRYIVIHHSATPNGNARAFDQFHKKRRHMQHGLAYHFVVDNGNGSPNGKVEVGDRWKEQWPGGHTANRLMNEIGIGICLVGNFEKTQPTSRQMESLVILIKLLQEKSNIPDRNVILHRHVSQKGTLCPGRKFPWERLRKMIRGAQLKGAAE